jgi:hypothetical protein
MSSSSGWPGDVWTDLLLPRPHDHLMVEAIRVTSGILSCKTCDSGTPGRGGQAKKRRKRGGGELDFFAHLFSAALPSSHWAVRMKHEDKTHQLPLPTMQTFSFLGDDEDDEGWFDIKRRRSEGGDRDGTTMEGRK